MLENAKYIWLSSESSPDSYAEFFDTFEYKNGEVCVDISVDGDYTLYINGEYASSSQYGDFEHYKIADTIDITALVRDGINTIAALVWHTGTDFQRYKKYDAGLIFEVRQGQSILALSNEHTLCRKSPTYKSGLCKKISSQLGFSYDYDSTKEDTFPRYAQGFSGAVEVEKKSTFFKRPIKKHALLPRVCGQIVSKNDNGTHYVLDLGREIVGFLTLDIFASEQTDINIAYGEHLLNGQVLRKIGDRDFSIDYRARAGENKYTNYMLRFACRYLELNSQSPVEINALGIIPQSYEAKRRELSLENELDAKIYEICVNTLDACMMEHYVDCPWREQCLYAFDSRNQMLAGYLAYEDKNTAYARSNLKLISMDRRDDGLLSICYPSGIDLTIPSFSLHYITALWEYLEASGDKSLIYEVDFKIKEIISTMLKREKNGILYAFEGSNHWCFYDWSPHLEGRLLGAQDAGKELMLTLLFIYALENYKKICTLCELPFEYDEKIQALRKGTIDTFFNEKSGLFSLSTDEEIYHSLPNSLAILLGLVPEQKCVKIAQKIAQGSLISSSLSMKCFEYDALLSVDKSYISQIKDEIREVYGKMLDFGSSTVWETKEGYEAFDNAGSLCHGWSAIVIKYLLM